MRSGLFRWSLLLLDSVRKAFKFFSVEDRPRIIDDGDTQNRIQGDAPTQNLLLFTGQTTNRIQGDGQTTNRIMGDGTANVTQVIQ